MKKYILKYISPFSIIAVVLTCFCVYQGYYEMLPLWLIIIYNEFKIIFLELTVKSHERRAFAAREMHQKLYDEFLKLHREYLDANEYRLMFFDQYDIKPKTNDQPDKSEERS